MNAEELVKRYGQGERDFSSVVTCNSYFGWRDLSGSNFSNADFSGSDFSGASLQESNFSGANLKRANFRGTDFNWANLNRADLSETNLLGATFYGANLNGTCLDPKAVVPLLTDKEILDAGLEIDGSFIFGWRTKNSLYNGLYNGLMTYHPGSCYSSPVFSVDPNSRYHPGLYFSAKKFIPRNFARRILVYVAAIRTEVVRVGDKEWRAKRLLVLSEHELST